MTAGTPGHMYLEERQAKWLVGGSGRHWAWHPAGTGHTSTECLQDSIWERLSLTFNLFSLPDSVSKLLSASSLGCPVSASKCGSHARYSSSQIQHVLNHQGIHNAYQTHFLSDYPQDPLPPLDLPVSTWSPTHPRGSCTLPSCPPQPAGSRHGLVNGLDTIAHGKLIHDLLGCLIIVHLPGIITLGVWNLHDPIVLHVCHEVEQVLP